MTPFFTIVNKYQTSFALYEMCMILRSFSIISPVKSITDKSQLQTNHFLNKPTRKNMPARSLKLPIVRLLSFYLLAAL